MTLSIAEDNSSLNMVHEGIITSKTISYPFDGTPVDDETPGGHKSKVCIALASCLWLQSHSVQSSVEK